MKIITLLALLSIAGCGDIPNKSILQTDGIPDNFLFAQSYGYCDTVCIGETVILEDVQGDKGNSLVVYVTTGDTVNNGLSHDLFLVNYNLSQEYTVNFGNGQIENFNNNGTFNINWKCNRTYEVIIE